MKLYAPKYYTDFICIADRCTHSCCVGWEIDVDSAAMQKYLSLPHGYGDTLRESIDTDGTPHFKLDKRDRCPHLNSKNLCKIILELGEDCLCDICREHPRFYNYSSLGREVGLGIACEEACRIVLNSDSFETVCIGTSSEDEYESEFDTVALREKIYSILADPALTHRDKLLKLQLEFDFSLSCITDSEVKDLIDSLEFLDESHRDRFKAYSSEYEAPASLERALERLLAYFVFRHCTEECDENTYRASLGMCLFLTRLFASVAANEKAESERELIEIARMISEEIEYSESNTEALKLEFLFRQ